MRALESLSQRLGDVFVANEGGSSNASRKENLVNEEGLPFVEIIEPVDELDTPSLTAASDEIINDHHPEPLSRLSEEAMVLNRQRRDKILQLLEEEEEREERRTKEQRNEELRRQRELARQEMEKRMVNQGYELEKRRRKSKDLEKRMAKALIGDSSNSEAKPKPTISPERQKKVTFAEPEPEGENHSESIRSKSRLTPPASRQPMKTEVIERAPAVIPPFERKPYGVAIEEQISQGLSSFNKHLPSPQSITFTSCDRDSDDESDLDDGLMDSTIPMESSDKDVSISAEVHRELTLEYQKRRSALKFDPNDVLMQLDPPKWNQENVPLKASLAQPPPKSTLSRFKESRIKQRIPKPSTREVGATFESVAIPHEILGNSIRMGKVIDGQLVGNDEETD